jgi:hypothetical protein
MRCPSCHLRIARGATCPEHPDVAAAAGPASGTWSVPEVPGWTLGALLGAGGFARVYAAVRRADGRPGALKIAHVPQDPRLEREAAALARLGPPLTPELLELTRTTEGGRVLALELLEGELLADRMAVRGAAWTSRLIVLTALAEAVDEVHAAGLVHRDLKPENVWLRGEGPACLFDFGLARSEHDEQLTGTGYGLGTATYMAPEMCAGLQVDARADLYALGVIAYELCTGRPPFVGDAARLRHAHAALRPPRASSFAPLPAAVDEVLDRALAKPPEARFGSARSLVEALAQAFAAAGAQAVAELPAAPPLSATRPVALLAVHLGPAAVRAAIEIAQRHGGQPARAHATLQIFVFAATQPPALLLAAAEDTERALRAAGLSEGGARVHLAELRVRESRRGYMVAGAALDQPSWAAPDPDERLEPSEPARAALDQERLPDEPPAPPLVGRDAVFDEVLATARAALAARKPCLVTLLGAPGTGKSSLLDALAGRFARELGAQVLVPRPGRPEWLGLALAGEAEEGGAAAPGVHGAFAARVALAERAAARLQAAALARPTVVLVDDAHRADHAGLDALELAVMSRDVPLVIVVATQPALLAARLAWGARAARHHLVELGPLDEGAAASLWLALLHPIDRLPASLLAQLDTLGERRPGPMVEMAQVLRRRGAVRRSGSAAGYYLASDELLAAGAGTLGERLAGSVVEGLVPALAELAYLCAVLGERIPLTRLRAAQAHLGGQLDVDVGVARLAERGLVRRLAPDHFGFASRLLARGLLARAPQPLLVRLHAAALAALEGAGERGEAFARHAAACGRSDDACAALLELADQARVSYGFFAAEAHYSAALALLAADDPRRQALLTGRGKCRYRFHRLDDALTDLRAARALAAAQGDAAGEAELLLEEATVLDWRFDLAEAEARIEEARPLVLGVGQADLNGRWQVAEGRAEYRRGEYARAEATLVAALGTSRDEEVDTIALLMLGAARLLRQDAEGAARRFSEAIASCERSGNGFHLAVAYSNRVSAWSALAQHERAEADARQATRLALEVGSLLLERMATFNLAEHLYFRGRHAEASETAERSFQLARRLHESPGLPEHVLLARICARAGDLEGARRRLAWIDETAPTDMHTPELQLLRRMVELAVRSPAAGPADWQALLDEPGRQALSHDEQAELEELAAQARRKDSGSSP